MMRIAFVVFAALFVATPAIATPVKVDPAEVQRLQKEHPAWAKWLGDPDLQEEVLTGEQMPNSQWRVHDIRAPQPPYVDTGTAACAVPTPSDAVVLFDGKDLSQWTGGHIADWTVHDGVVTAGGKTYNFISSKEKFGDLQVHVEWMAPLQPNPPLDPQHRGNSGVFLMGLYELQIVDSYHNETYPDGTTGAIYGTAPPLVNAVRPPATWNCYDIMFRAPRFKDGKLESPGWITAFLNGALVQSHTTLLGPTATPDGAVAHYAPEPPELPLAIQDHGNPESRDSFRNVWVRRLKLD